MASSNTSWKRTVFRLRGLPGQVQTFKQAAELLRCGLSDLDVSDIRVCSLATTLNSWKVSTKVATVMLKSRPRLLATQASSSEWHIDVDFQDDPLILDTHFLGLTPLNDVPTEHHTIDCVAISGLASHPFGSWAAKGNDKGFMWIRDELPSAFPGMRTIIYGYNSDMDDLTSFQSIGDLARGMIDRLGASRWKSPTSPKIVFLAHSLGGILLKEAISQLSKSQEAIDKNLLDRIIGAILLGVPNLGMEQEHFLSLVERQPNESLVETLSRDSDFLRKLDNQFSDIIKERNIKVFWGYETRASPIRSKKNQEDGKPARAEDTTVLVNPNSATSRMIIRCRALTFSINETHSELAKFLPESDHLNVLISKLRAITESFETECVPPATLAEKRPRPPTVPHRKQPPPPALPRRKSNKQRDLLRKIMQKDKKATKQAPALRKRLRRRIPGFLSFEQATPLHTSSRPSKKKEEKRKKDLFGRPSQMYD